MKFYVYFRESSEEEWKNSYIPGYKSMEDALEAADYLAKGLREISKSRLEIWVKEEE
jgi:hypothetical protein